MSVYVNVSVSMHTYLCCVYVCVGVVAAEDGNGTAEPVEAGVAAYD